MTRTVIAQWTHIQRKLAGLHSDLAEQTEAHGWSPNTDVDECADGLVVKMELAGVPAGSIRILLDDKMLVIEGERRDPCSGETGAGNRFRQLEIEYGPFHRVIPLPYAVQASHSKARCENGVLEIRLPKSAHRSTRRVSITMKS